MQIRDRLQGLQTDLSGRLNACTNVAKVAAKDWNDQVTAFRKECCEIQRARERVSARREAVSAEIASLLKEPDGDSTACAQQQARSDAADDSHSDSDTDDEGMRMDQQMAQLRMMIEDARRAAQVEAANEDTIQRECALYESHLALVLRSGSGEPHTLQGEFGCLGRPDAPTTAKFALTLDSSGCLRVVSASPALSATDLESLTDPAASADCRKHMKGVFKRLRSALQPA